MAMQFPTDKLHLFRREGVLSYEYWDSIERFYEEQLPSKEAFYSHLTGHAINDQDYNHAQQGVARIQHA